MKKLPALILLLFSAYLNAAQAPWVGADLKGFSCTGGTQGYGPYDYTKTNEREKIPIVEQYHFPKNTEYLIKPVQGNFAGDFDYTLRAVPNHHRALLSLTRYQIQLNTKLKNTQKPFSPVECYFQRAINFSPRDATTRALYAYYLHKVGQNEQAMKFYDQAASMSPDSTKILYSFSLFLLDIKKYDKAVEIAHKVYKDKKAPDALKNKLIKLKLWNNNN